MLNSYQLARAGNIMQVFTDATMTLTRKRRRRQAVQSSTGP
jgi:hypothetical protein